MYETTLYVLAGALVLLGWSCCRVFPRLPHSGGLRGLRFWLALLLVVALDRVLNTAFFTAETSLYDADDAVLALIEASILFVVTGIVLRSPNQTD
ncbi:MAG: hypothetical protein FGM53_02325 [Rhodocyclaceae bacterium]|jgi:hypothetical protein|nr:hypothetical protein [Rhodocyclaceae bacterium]